MVNLSDNEILSQVTDEYNRWLESVRTKREKFRKRLEMYANISWDDKKLYVRMIYAVMQTMLGVYFQDDLTITFEWRTNSDNMLADNLNNLAKFDFEEMNLDILNYKVQWDRFFYWVWIRVFDRWDEEKNLTEFKHVSPINWIPDPRGNYWNEFRWHWFELTTTKRQLEEAWVFENLNQVEATVNSETDQTRSALDNSRSMSFSNADVTEQPIINIYNHYTYLNWVPYLITLANERKTIIRKVDLTDFGWFPVALNYYSPLEWDPFGVSINDLLEDKQKQQQLFLNLQTFKATREAWGWIFMVNTNKVGNTQDLRTPWLWPKFVEIEWDVANAIVEVERDKISQDVYNMPDIIKNQAINDLWLDERALWVIPQTWVTKAENIRVQQNQNVKLGLVTRINKKWEADFWRIWYKAYKIFFNDESEKNISLNSVFWNNTYPIKASDILTNRDIRIKVTSKSEKENEINAKKAEFAALTQPILMDPSVSKTSKNFIYRKRFEQLGVSDADIAMMVQPSGDELQAMEDLVLLNEWEFIDLEITPEVMNQSHMEYINIYRQAPPSEARSEAIATRLELYKLSWQQAQDRQLQMQQWGWWQIGNAQAAQLTANMMSQEQSSEVPSLQDV